MPFAFELHFDADAERAVRELWNALDLARICDMRRNGTAPHITLAIAEQKHIDDLKGELISFVEGEPCFAFSLESIGTFSAAGVAFLSPRKTAQLESIHNRFHARFALPDAPNSSLYKPAAWTPHCTVATGVAPDKLAEAIEICRRLPLPVRGQIEQLVIVRWPDVTEQFRCRLVSPSAVKG